VLIVLHSIAHARHGMRQRCVDLDPMPHELLMREFGLAGQQRDARDRSSSLGSGAMRRLRNFAA